MEGDAVGHTGCCNPPTASWNMQTLRRLSLKTEILGKLCQIDETFLSNVYCFVSFRTRATTKSISPSRTTKRSPENPLDVFLFVIVTTRALFLVFLSSPLSALGCSSNLLKIYSGYSHVLRSHKVKERTFDYLNNSLIVHH